jgi:mevalonate kinase
LLISTKHYPAKIILFGEHTVIQGAQALALPIPDFFGTWKFENDATKQETLQQNLPLFKTYLEKEMFKGLIDTFAFSTALEQGLFFESNIPTGYGMGSSGALCAAIFDTFGLEINSLPLKKIKSFLGQMESFFHGASSGTDPLVSYLNHPVVIQQEIQKTNLIPSNKNGKGAVFLLDTGVKREASPFINGFLERCKSADYNDQCIHKLVPSVNRCIKTFLNGEWQLLFEEMHQLSQFQFNYFDFMILDAFKELWAQSLKSKHYRLKICGAGGGGFLLGISNDFNQTQKELKQYALQVVYQF